MPDYSKVCTKIIEHYENCISEKEKEILEKIIKVNDYNNFNIEFINKILDRIWNMFLTNKKNYKDGESFNFLVVRMNFSPYYLNDLKQMQNSGSYTLELLNEKSAIETSIWNTGLIVEIDYSNFQSFPLLPMDFIEKKYITANVNLRIEGIYNISLNVLEYGAEEDVCSLVSAETNLKHIKINKPLLNKKINNKVLDKSDIEELSTDLIVWYFIMVLKQSVVDIKLRDELIKKHKKLIKEKYLDYFNNQITLDEFATIIFNVLENDELIPHVDKKM